MMDLFPQVDGVVILVCDQPHLDQMVIGALIEAQRDAGLPIAASSYGGKLGTPALFHKAFFPDLMSLSGDMGARKMLEQKKDEMVSIDFEMGAVDIDTQEDFEQLLNNDKSAE